MKIQVGTWLTMWVLLAGCVHGAGQDFGTAPEEAEEIRVSFLTPKQVEAFEREIAGQYRQLDLHYRVFDQVEHGEITNLTDFEEHRLHRKLFRRHLTLARHHEERTRLRREMPALAEEDRHLARLHREAARWHRARWDEESGAGVMASTPELISLRRELELMRSLIAPRKQERYNEEARQRSKEPPGH